MLCYRDFAVQDGDRRYSAGPVLSLAARTHSRAALLRTVARPHLTALAERVAESTNLIVLAGDHVRFIGSVEGTQALRGGQPGGHGLPRPPDLRRGATAGGPACRAVRRDLQRRAVGGPPRQAARRKALRREMRLARGRGFAINNGRTETGVTAVGRAVRGTDGLAEAAVSISLPTARYSRTVLPQLVAVLAVTTADIERELAAAVNAQVS